MKPLRCSCGSINSSIRPFDISPKFYDQYSSDYISSQGHLMIVKVLCDMHKESIKFLKKKPLNFCKLFDNKGPISSSCGPIISSIRPFDILFLA